jgi:hypothetical protein
LFGVFAGVTEWSRRCWTFRSRISSSWSSLQTLNPPQRRDQKQYVKPGLTRQAQNSSKNDGSSENSSLLTCALVDSLLRSQKSHLEPFVRSRVPCLEYPW